jgi:Ser/Thr protein kinase RdoA (MazF antagonist)
MTLQLPNALLPELLALVQDQWPVYFPGQRRPRSLSYTLQGTGVGKLIVFVLAAGESRPRCILKIPRSRRENDSLAHEHWMITELRQRRGPAGDAELPAPLAAPMVQGWQVVVEKMLPGSLFSSAVPMGANFTLPVAGQHLRLVRDWLVTWQRAAHPEAVRLTAEDVRDLFLGPIKEAQSTVELRPHELVFLDQMGQRAEGLVGRRVPLGFVHGDLRPGNILKSGEQLCVLDWQFAQMRALPLLDWFEFGYRYYCDAASLEEITGDHDAYRATFADVFLGAHPYASLLAEETIAIADALEVPSDLLDLLLAMWLVDNTNKYLRFLTDRAEHGYLYLMQNPPGGPFRSYRQQLRRQVYPSLLGQLAQSRGLSALAHTSDSARPLRFSMG